MTERNGQEWPAYVYADNGRRYAFSGVHEDGCGMYGGMAGYPLTLKQARAYSVKREVQS